MIIRDGYKLFIKSIFKQLDSSWEGIDHNIIEDSSKVALKQLEKILFNLSRRNKYVWKDMNEPVFTPMNSVQYSVYLYLLSRAIFLQHGGVKEADVVYCLNKMMNSCDWFYAVNLPEIFYVEHPIGSVMGRAEYGNNFFFYQGCTVGGNRDKEGNLCYPVIGKNVLMYANSSIFGNAYIGNNVIISAGVTIIGGYIPDNAVVFGKSPNLVIKRQEREKILRRQIHIWEAPA